MKTWNRNGIRTALCRGLVVVGLTVSGLAVQADDTESKESAGGPASGIAGKSGDTKTCIQEAAKMNVGVIKVAQLAAQKAENAELKRFAQTLEQEHKKSQTELQQIAGKHNVTLPTELDEKCKEEISKLEALSGREFDRQFAKNSVEGHAMAAAHLEQASSQVTDAELRQYTLRMLAQVKEHQRRSRDIARAVGVDQATITSLENKAREGVGGPAAGTESSGTERSTTLENKTPEDNTSDNKQ